MTQGIHHISAIASDGKKSIDFYTKILGLRLVKKTVNQDDTSTYHLFFGDRYGHPGMDLTFFIFNPVAQGIRGNGLVTTISLVIPESAMSFWMHRLAQFQVKHELPVSRFDCKRIVFFDNDGQQLELVVVPDTELIADTDVWTTKDVDKNVAIRSFHSATLSVMSLASIAPVLTEVLGYTQITSEDHNHLFAVTESSRAHLLEASERPDAEPGFNAAGTVHHIAFRANDEAEQLAMRDAVINLGLYPTEVIDRFYFKSVYFRTAPGILFEIATDGPGFTADESESELGTHISLPPFLEPERETIESQLLPL